MSSAEFTEFERELINHDSVNMPKPIDNFYIVRLDNNENRSLYKIATKMNEGGNEYTVHNINVMDINDIGNEFVFRRDIVFSDIWDMALAARDYSTSNGWYQDWSGTPEDGYRDSDCIMLDSFITLWDAQNPNTPHTSNPRILVIELATISYIMEQF